MSTQIGGLAGGIADGVPEFRSVVALRERKAEPVGGELVPKKKVRIPVKRATYSGNKKATGVWADPMLGSIAGWLF